MRNISNDIQKQEKNLINSQQKLIINNFAINDEYLENLINYPHLLGHLMGKEKLNSLHSEWIKYCWDSDYPIALQAFRGSYKSTSIVVVGTIRWLLTHPNDRIAIIRKSVSDSATIVQSIRQALEMLEIKEVFKYAHGFYPKAIINREGRLRYNFKTTITPELSVTAHGIDSSLTGLHYDKIVCDDIITLKDRISKAEREHTKEAVREIATNIIDPNKGSIWIGTPWHRDDAWNDINKFADIALYPIDDYNFLGEAEKERKKQTTTPFLYAINYDLEIRKDTTSLFQNFEYLDGWDYSKTSYAQLDAAFDGDHYCALSILSPLDTADCTNAKKFQCVGFTYAGNVKAWINEIARYCRKYKVRYLFIETNPDKGYVAAQLQKLNLRVKTYNEKQNKHIKISTNLYEYWSRIKFSQDTDLEFLNQILDYRENSEPDDAPDSLASLIRELCKPSQARVKNLYEF